MGGDIKYTCSNGSWSKTGRCIQGCNDTSPIYDINGNKISNQLYGTSFANNGNNNEIHTYQVCYKNNDTSTAYNLNTNKTGIGNMNPEEYIRCGPHLDNLKGFYTQVGRKLICKNNSNFSYWQYQYASCSLNELVNISGLNIKLAYGGFGSSYAKDIGTIMNSGARQERFPAYYNSGYQAEWSKPYTAFKENIEGFSASRNVDIYCNSNGTWSVVTSGYVEYNYTGGVQIFTPSKYGLSNGKQLTLEVYGAKGKIGKAEGGKGGYSYGNYISNGNSLYVYIGGTDGYNGGGNGYSGGGKGGGGTDIRTSMNNNYNNRIIVAGGGGGGGGAQGNYRGSKGGNGGGNNNNGEDGKTISDDPGAQGKGGTLNNGGKGGTKGTAEDGSFGKGGSANTSHGGGGGGGYYGGGSANGGWNGAGGGGGSGYCGIDNCSGANGVNGSDTEINGVKTNGNGYAKISW